MFNDPSMSCVAIGLIASAVCLSTSLPTVAASPMTNRLVRLAIAASVPVIVTSSGSRPAAQNAAKGVRIRLTVSPEALTLVKTVRIAGTYNNWAPPQAMTSRGNGVFEFIIADSTLVGKTVQYRLYPGGGGGWDGAEGPDAFKRDLQYAPNTEIVLKDIVFGESTAATAPREPTVINVDPDQKFQKIDGFGAALTDSSAWLIGKSLKPAQREALLLSLFDAKAGAGFSYMRLPIGASDFSLSEHTYDDMPTGDTDYDMKHFSVSYDESYIIPVASQIKAINPALKFMASPWSAPAWMKDTGKLDGGRLKSDDATYSAYADYLTRFVKAYAARGIPIDMMTLQNEPRNQTTGYPSMGMEPGDEIRLARLVGEAFKAAKIKTRIVVWDHNWDHPEYPIQVLGDAGSRPYIDGAAFHGYAGDVPAQSKFHDAFPDKNIYFTESTGGNFAPEFSGNLMWDTTNLIVGSTRNWAKTVLKWNLALDEKNRPHVPGGPDNCRGIVTINQETGAVTREEEYYAFAHASKFVQPGATRIFSDNPSTVAFANPDGAEAMILFNAGFNNRSYSVHEKDHVLTESLPPRSVATLVWAANARGPVQVWMTTGDQTKLLSRQPDLSFESH